METKVYFENIRETIFEHLNDTKYNIYVAVAWITDTLLWEKLCEKALTTDVKVLLVDDEINRNSNLDFDKFINNGGKLYFGNHHHKFCIIDLKTLISGSYNWTYYANNRIIGENIEVKKYAYDICEQYADVFKKLIEQNKVNTQLNSHQNYKIENKPSNIIKINKTRTEILKSISINLPDLIPYRIKDKWGYCDKWLNIKIPFIFDLASEFYGNVAIVETEKKIGLINNLGKYIVLPQEDISINCWNGKFIEVILSYSNRHLYNLEGNKIIDDTFEDLKFNNDCSLLLLKKDKLYAVYDLMGNKITDHIYEKSEYGALSITEKGAFISMKKDGKWGFIDKKGNTIIPFIYDDVREFSEGLAAVKSKNKWGYINESNSIIVDFNWTDADLFEEGVAIIKDERGYGVINKEGKNVIWTMFGYESINRINNGLIAVKKKKEDKGYEYYYKIENLVKGITNSILPCTIIDSKHHKYSDRIMFYGNDDFFFMSKQTKNIDYRR